MSGDSDDEDEDRENLIGDIEDSGLNFLIFLVLFCWCDFQVGTHFYTHVCSFIRVASRSVPQGADRAEYRALDLL
jgi:hypothetical protein